MKTKKKQFFLYGLLILITAFTLSACGEQKDDTEDAMDDAVEEVEEPTREEMNETVEPVDSEQFLGEEADLPEDFPSDAYMLKDSRVTLVTSNEQDDEKFFNVTIESGTTLKDAIDSYKNGMKDQGWELDGEVENEGDTVLSFVKGDRSASVSLADVQGVTLITLYIEK